MTTQKSVPSDVRVSSDAQLRARVLTALAGESQSVAGWWKRYANGPDAHGVVELRELLHQSEPMALALLVIHGAFGAELQRVRDELSGTMPSHAGCGWPEGEPKDGEDALDAECAPVPTPSEWRAMHEAADRYVRALDWIGEALTVAKPKRRRRGGGPRGMARPAGIEEKPAA